MDIKNQYIQALQAYSNGASFYEKLPVGCDVAVIIVLDMSSDLFKLFLERYDYISSKIGFGRSILIGNQLTFNCPSPTQTYIFANDDDILNLVKYCTFNDKNNYILSLDYPSGRHYDRLLLENVSLDDLLVHGIFKIY